MARVAVLSKGSESGRMVFHALRGVFGDVHAIVEERRSRVQMAKRRRQRLGTVAVAGQVAFQLAMVPVLRRLGRNRAEQIHKQFGTCRDPLPEDLRTDVTSVNSEECRRELARLSPEIIVVCGTRIIGKRTLSCTDAPFINIHVGLTPKYRGVHGGYWSLARGDKESFGVTIHRVDEGIDTGAVIRHVSISPAPEDNFATYPVLQIAAVLDPLTEVVASYLDGQGLEKCEGLTPSQLFYHPTLWQYLRGLTRGVR